MIIKMGYNVCAKHVVAVCNGINDCLIRHVGLINVREYRKGNQKGQSRETGTRREKKIQYVLDTTIRKQTKTKGNKTCALIQTSFYAEIVTDITTGNLERKYTK
jgi:hypothetical protein